MKWTTPDFEEINLSGEVTAYVNTDDDMRTPEQHLSQAEMVIAGADKPRERTT